VIVYTGREAACSNCGTVTTFADDATGLPQHVACLGLMTRPQHQAPAGPRPAQPATLPEHLEATAARALLRIQDTAQQCEGDLEKIMKKSIPMVMDLFDEVRTFGRLPIIHHPPVPEVFNRVKGKSSPHQVWLAKHRWPDRDHPIEPRGPVTPLDAPGSYLNAFKCWLPIQALRHDTSGAWSKQMAGVYRITPPAWNVPDLPNPIGDREEEGDIWVTSATLNLLMRCCGRWVVKDEQWDLCDEPVIHEAWTAKGSEDLLTGLRAVLAYLRSQAIQHQDTLTLEVVKNMYSKFYATIGDSPDNRRMRRPEWSAIIQAQAAANLWYRAYEFRKAGLQLVKVTATDEIHVAGDWRSVFTEGHELTQMKIKEH
jgi:hypothetical protein